MLQEVELPYIDPKSCKKMLETNLGESLRISDAMLCAGGQEGKDSCQGDSGGPLVRRLSSNQWVISGIVSAGYSCGGKNIPAIYTRVSSIAEWIYDTSDGQVFSDVRINGDVFKPDSQSELNWDLNLGWGDVNCLGKSRRKVHNPRIYSVTKFITINKPNYPITVKPKKSRFLPPEGSDNFELEFEVKAQKNAFINLCRKTKYINEKNRIMVKKWCVQFLLGALESDNYVSP